MEQKSPDERQDGVQLGAPAGAAAEARAASQPPLEAAMSAFDVLRATSVEELGDALLRFGIAGLEDPSQRDGDGLISPPLPSLSDIDELAAVDDPEERLVMSPNTASAVLADLDIDAAGLAPAAFHDVVSGGHAAASADLSSELTQWGAAPAAAAAASADGIGTGGQSFAVQGGAGGVDVRSRSKRRGGRFRTRTIEYDGVLGAGDKRAVTSLSPAPEDRRKRTRPSAVAAAPTPAVHSGAPERRLRKNEREKQRRAALNHQFDRLAALCNTQRKHRTDQVPVLRDVIGELESLSREVATLETQVRAYRPDYEYSPNLHTGTEEAFRAADVGAGADGASGGSPRSVSRGDAPTATSESVDVVGQLGKGELDAIAAAAIEAVAVDLGSDKTHVGPHAPTLHGGVVSPTAANAAHVALDGAPGAPLADWGLGGSSSDALRSGLEFLRDLSDSDANDGSRRGDARGRYS